MKLKFKKQAFQTRAVESVVDCFKGQPNTAGIGYRIDPGLTQQQQRDLRSGQLQLPDHDISASGFKNGDIVLTDKNILENI